MAENTRRSSTRNAKSKTKEKSARQLSFDWAALTSSPKNTLVAGMVLLVISVLLEVAFLSYLFTGAADQSEVGALGTAPLRDVGAATRNVLGVFGAFVSQVFVYRWFGLAALLVPVVPFLAGWRMVFGADLVNLSRTTKEVIFFTLWVSIFLGYIVLISGSSASLSFLPGGFGFYVNELLSNLIGYGSIVIILVFLFCFAVYFYNLNPVERWQQSQDKRLARQQDQDYVDDPEDSTEESPSSHTQETTPTVSVLDQTYDDPVETEEVIDSEEPETEVDVEPVLEAKLELELDEAPPVAIPQEEDPDPDELSEEILRNFGQYDPTLDLPSFQYPSLDILNDVDDSAQQKVSHDELESNKERIVDTLASYGINISKIKATIGPTVTLYEIIPEAGVRISKIQNLEKDIALSLAALGIRIIAPMPGRGTIGIEVPNKNRETVFIRSVLNSDRFQKSNYDLPVVLGKTVSNEIYVADLARMPHLLMAGATGQGKSVGLNVILASLIYKKHPAQLKFVLVDPKKVELTLFNKLERHYLAKLPNSDEAIITDTKKVIHTLNSLCIEMDNRYDLLKEATARNLKEYNAKFVQRKLNPENGHHFLPYIVLVIDELADLMMTAGKEVETPIARLAQLARAVGIHLVLATQRPSVKVITGLIKANFPARLSFRVTSSIDSRTILDSGGAEQLVGQGDMLLAINSEIVRLQCPYIDTREIEDVCEFIGSQRGYGEAYALPEYEGEDGDGSRGDVNTEDFDQLLPDAARLVITHQQGSTSLIQRKMKLGYNRAGRIMDQLEILGVVGPFTGSKARDVMFHDLESLEQHLNSVGV
ncbi:FtsK/SpoIIIE family DNA translocase [Persicitalea jodogahamensis]|uniref:DNA translocase FtsK n=1 Tax=Persicitalea jodogahamensis TaxID=402147 RepID=A0A8J3D6E4_9BACT|nr:DNA translocase FtsK [Persicitalea jodogahamensis]GHB56692.1 DNA translocase FtsK [Persicitalea jodogahamensis]